MRSAIMRKAAGEIAVLEEIVGEGVEDVVEGILPMRPAFQEMADIERQLSRLAPTRAGAISIWWKDWYQMWLSRSGAAMRGPMPG